jgi:hypothetical protein
MHAQRENGGINPTHRNRNPPLEGCGCSAPRSGRFTPDKDQVPIMQEVGLASGPFWRVRKISRTPEFERRTIQPVASRCTGFATPVA